MLLLFKITKAQVKYMQCLKLHDSTASTLLSPAVDDLNDARPCTMWNGGRWTSWIWGHWVYCGECHQDPTVNLNVLRETCHKVFTSSCPI